MSEPSNSSPVSGAAQPVSGAGAAPGAPGAGSGAMPAGSATGVNAKPEIQFNSSAIGTITARHEDPFKEHKARAAEKKKQSDKIRKRVLIVLGVILALLLIGLGIWWVINTQNQPVAEEPGFLQDETIKDIQANANEIYNAESEDSDEQDFEGATEYYEDQKQNAATIGDWNRITIAEMLFCAANSRPECVVENGDGINPNDLPLDEALTYCNAMINAWASLGEPEKAEECRDFIDNNSTIPTDGEG